MGTLKVNIDDLLDETFEITKEGDSFHLLTVEIDSLLEYTRHWQNY